MFSTAVFSSPISDVWLLTLTTIRWTAFEFIERSFDLMIFGLLFLSWQVMFAVFSLPFSNTKMPRILRFYDTTPISMCWLWVHKIGSDETVIYFYRCCCYYWYCFIVGGVSVFLLLLCFKIVEQQQHARTQCFRATFLFGWKYEDQIYVHDTACQTLPAYMFHLTHHQLSFSRLIASSPNFSPACNDRKSNRAQQKKKHTNVLHKCESTKRLIIFSIRFCRTRREIWCLLNIEIYWPVNSEIEIVSKMCHFRECNSNPVSVVIFYFNPHWFAWKRVDSLSTTVTMTRLTFGLGCFQAVKWIQAKKHK